ncbi:ISNCY family transposase [Clostridium estertheticum]|uniref:ISNCY family transposase n=1 Tax=Clostridium estertheticum TaxID=238834 RepID=UPI0027155ABE|nr:ISNCY family transposase [Clostridium estertheticum]WLC83821.1 ISNCY family transposase [Clostridium estertheticum]
MNEDFKYQIIKKLVDVNGNKKAAVLRIGCTVRHLNRMIRGYRSKGKEFFIHGNKGIKPIHTISEDIRCMIIDLYKIKYHEANFTHYAELLDTHEGISVYPSTVNTILMAEHILYPKASRVTKKRVKKEVLEQLKASSLSTHKKDYIEKSIIAIEDAHPRRSRCAYFGEMLQMDASLHLWFGDTKSQLHIAIDDSTGVIVGAYFDHQETLKGYYNIFHQILLEYGIPYMFFTDRRTVFEYKQKKAPTTEEDTFTQFGYACKQLGVEIRISSVPQAKGRVERLFQTLQSRLPLELRIAGVTTIEQANVFLNHYVKEFNAKFALNINNTKSVFETQPTVEKINLTLAVLADRKVDCGHFVRFESKYYKPIDTDSNPTYFRKGTSALVIKAFDDEYYVSIENKIYGLEVIPDHKTASKNFDFPKDNPVKCKSYVPPMSHPWKHASFQEYLDKQIHRSNKTG